MLRLVVCGVMGAALLSGCGYTEEEMAAKQREINVLTAEVHALRTAGAPGYRYAPTKPSHAGGQARVP
jgi:hypothetical protein